MPQRSVIKVRFTQPGWHRWPEAPEQRNYLAADHRHLFHFQVELEVLHDNREIEFHDFLDWCKRRVFIDGSCEQIAEGLLERIQQVWPHRLAAVEVWEDNECGARVEILE